jgi:hypothetical protein
VPWDKTPFVPRPSLIADPITAFGKPKPKNQQQERSSILDRINREAIKPDQRILNRPIDPYISTRDRTRERVLGQVRRQEQARSGEGGNPLITSKDSMDVVLHRLHHTTPAKYTHRHVIFSEPTLYKRYEY